MAFEADGRKLRIGDGDAAGVLAAIEFRPDTEAGPTVGRPNQAHDGGEVDERRAAPVHRNVRKQPVLDLVPFARPWREMTHRDGEARAVGELLPFLLPQTQAGAVAAARVGGDQQRLGLAIRRTAHLLPPAPNRLHGEGRGVVIDPPRSPSLRSGAGHRRRTEWPSRQSWGWPGSRSRGPARAAAISPDATCSPDS